MPKRRRHEGAKDVRAELSLDSGRRFDAYIRGWMRETIEPQVVRPSSLPPLTPLLPLVSSPAPATCPGEAPHLTEANGTPNKAEACILHSLSPVAPVSLSGGTAVVYDDAMLGHVSPDPTDYERPARLRTTLDHLKAVGLLACCQRVPARSAKTKELRRVHSRDLVDTIDQLDFFMSIRDQKGGVIGQDLFASEHTSRAARVAAGCVIEAAAAVVSGTSTNAFALVRPPGHHAGPGNASGFCFYNNVAVAARAAQAQLTAMQQGSNGSGADAATEAKRPHILILDWDVHHCDGTESIFYDDPSVLVISLHQYGNGRGHVLRKTPSTELTFVRPGAGVAAAEANATTNTNSVNDKEEINVADLAALLLEAPNEKSAECVEHNEGKAKTRDAVLPTESAKDHRVRKAVDYNKLAAEVEGDGADDIAALFGVDITAVSSSSSSSSISTASGLGAAESSASFAAPRNGLTNAPAVHYAGDTVGISFDDFEAQAAQQAAEEPFYPGTGHVNRVGGDTVAAAAGRNINIAWPTHDMGDLEYLQLMHEVVLPAAREFQPALVFISSGFDSARGDLLGSMSLTPSGFYLMTRLMAAHFPKLVVALEGGYNLKNVALGAEAVLRALLESSGCNAEKLPKSRMLWCQAADLVAEVKKMHASYWRCFSDSDIA